MAAAEMNTPPEQPQELPTSSNAFYRKYYFYFLIGLWLLILMLIAVVFLVLYQMRHRPLPVFNATTPAGETMPLVAYQDPNLLPDVILTWAAKATTIAYTFDYVNYRTQLQAARPYFTKAGWQDYLNSVDRLISTIVENQLFVYGVVSGVPIISNEGPLPGVDYAWRVQIPFLVTYQSANVPVQQRFVVVVTIIRVPTSVNPQGIGIDQFVMVSTG